MTQEHVEPSGSAATEAMPELAPAGGNAGGRRRSRLLAVGTVLAGLLTAVVGFVLFGMGMGFSNATASGVGAAGFVVGLWMVLAVRGVARRRLATFVGLGAAWAWVIGCAAVNFPAVVVSGVVVVFLIPAISVPVALAWALLLVLVAAGGLVRMIGAYRHWRRTPVGERGGVARPAVGLGVRLALLVAATVLMPPLVWAERGQKIAELARRYAPPQGEARRRPDFGACSVVFLGYELTQQDPGPSKTREERLAACAGRLADAKADLASIAAAGARYVRVGASGDHLFGNDPERAAFQETLDDEYMGEVRRAGVPLVLVDTQHPQRLPHRLDWQEFCAFQRQRVEYYQRRYRPSVYVTVCEPMNYHYFALRPGAAYSAEAWAAQLSDMCRLIKSIDPATRTGICLLVMDNNKPEWDVWARMKTLPELDILSVEIYSPENFQQTEERLREFGHPAAGGKTFWIAETYNGWALCGDRRWDQDVAWLHVASDFAGATRAEAVLVWTFGSFVGGGSLADYGKGRLAARWQSAHGLSAVGRGFADLQAGPALPSPPAP
jgi:hypothetical protein